MKIKISIISIMLSCFLIKDLSAQVKLLLSPNISMQPVWGPVGYDHAEYYYMPDIDAYYYVPKRQYIYQDKGNWMFTPALPARFSNYNIYNGYKVVINEPQPYRQAETYRIKYASFKGNRGQQIIRYSKDPRYFGNPHHPEHKKWKSNNGKKFNKHNNSGKGHKKH